MDTHSICIVGASRGIGLGLAREFAGRGFHVLATERHAGADLHALSQDGTGQVDVVTLDVADPGADGRLRDALGDRSLDILVINAGITGAAHQSAAQATAEEIAEVMVTNAFGPARLAGALLPCMRDGGTIGLMSSRMGSIADSSGGYDLYRTSKAAQNMLAKGLAQGPAAERGVAVLSLHPGWVQTAMGGPAAPLSVEESVSGLADVLTAPHTGGHRFVDWRGEALPF